MRLVAVKRVMIGLAVIGLGVASYVTYVHYAGIKPICSAGGSCATVQSSVYNNVLGVPVALIGLLGYIAILASLFAPESENSRLATTLMTVVGFAFSAYLTYREAFSIHAYCEWCLSSAAVMTILACLSTLRFLRVAPELGGPAPAGPTPGRAEDGDAATAPSPSAADQTAVAAD
jgi:uncharacterized membrane protein